jgi:dephospho-CoA kinase
MMKVIGLTGGIGSGKSTVSQFLAEWGAVVIDADEVGHDALRTDVELRHEVVAAFGRHILTPEGDIDRGKLGEIVFGDSESRVRLNQIMHPRMYNMVKAQLGDYRQRGVDVVVLEAPLLIEADWTLLVDEVWVVLASGATVLRRLKEKYGFSRSQSLARIHSQLSSKERLKYADVVINNDGSLDQLKIKVEELWRRLHAPGAGEADIPA